MGPGLCHVRDGLWSWPVHRRMWLWNSKSSTIVYYFYYNLSITCTSRVLTCGHVFSLVSAPCVFDMYEYEGGMRMKRELERYLKKIGNENSRCTLATIWGFSIGMLSRREQKLSRINCPARPLIGLPLYSYPTKQTVKISVGHYFVLLGTIFCLLLHILM